MTLKEEMKQTKLDIELYTRVRNHTTQDIRRLEKKPATFQTGKSLREARSDRDKYNRKLVNLRNKELRLKVQMGPPSKARIVARRKR